MCYIWTNFNDKSWKYHLDSKYGNDQYINSSEWQKNKIYSVKLVKYFQCGQDNIWLKF